MEKRLKNYITKIENYLSNDSHDTDPKLILEDLIIQISFFQHERLIHLLVTIAFALFCIISIFICIISISLASIVLSALFIILLIPYIRHYYILENGVQKLYGYYDLLKETN